MPFDRHNEAMEESNHGGRPVGSGQLSVGSESFHQLSMEIARGIVCLPSVPPRPLAGVQFGQKDKVALVVKITDISVVRGEGWE